ncbi:MAG: DNA helicase, partial [Cyclobacteriaceae bacterium]
LNVAVTRARREIVLVTSLKPSDFKDQHLTNPGIRLLKAYIEYVENIQQGKFPNFPTDIASEYDQSWSLKNRLIGIYGNHEVKENNFGKVMDLVVMEEGKSRTAILTDDQRFYASKSAKEAFVYHPRMLSSRNWNMVFLFSRQYWLDKDDLLQTRVMRIGKEDET